MMVANGDNYDVHKQGPDKQPSGKPLNKKPMAKQQASAFISSMMASDASSTKGLTPFDLVELEKKCGDMMPMYANKLDDDDPRVNYDPLGGRTGTSACAACRWFHAGSASCDLVYGDIVATGVCDLFLAAELPEPTTPTPEPIPVTIVDQGEMAVKSPDDFAYVPDKETPSSWKLPIHDEQHARLALAAIGSNPPHGNKVQIPAANMPTVRKKVEAAIRKFVTDKTEVKRLLGGKSLLDQFIDFIGGKSTDAEVTEDGFKVLPDGRWRAWWTNNAKDRVGENFSAKAIDAYIARVDAGKVPYPELWYKHLPMRMGKADALARIGYMTFATGKFYDTPVGQKGRAYLEAEQKAGHGKTNSHGYLYPTNLLKKGVYNAFNTFEISVLDPGEEANPYTNFEVKTMFAKLDEKKFEELKHIFGEEAVRNLQDFGETTSKGLENTPGVDLKSFSSFEGVEVEDKTAHAAVKALGEATLEGMKRIGDRLDAIAESVKTVQTTVDEKVNASAKAVADLKAFVESELSFTPRASKAAETRLAADNKQVTHLQQANEEAGKNKSDAVKVDGGNGTKSIFDHILEAAQGPQ